MAVLSETKVKFAIKEIIMSISALRCEDMGLLEPCDRVILRTLTAGS